MEAHKVFLNNLCPGLRLFRRGDGNCFYRALYVALFELLLAEGSEGSHFSGFQERFEQSRKQISILPKELVAKISTYLSLLTDPKVDEPIPSTEEPPLPQDQDNGEPTLNPSVQDGNQQPTKKAKRSRRQRKKAQEKAMQRERIAQFQDKDHSDSFVKYFRYVTSGVLQGMDLLDADPTQASSSVPFSLYLPEGQSMQQRCLLVEKMGEEAEQLEVGSFSFMFFFSEQSVTESLLDGGIALLSEAELSGMPN